MRTEHIEIGKTYIGKAQFAIPRTVVAVGSWRDFEDAAPTDGDYVQYHQGGKSLWMIPIRRFAKWARQEAEIVPCKFCSRTTVAPRKVCHACYQDMRPIAIEVTDSITHYVWGEPKP